MSIGFVRAAGIGQSIWILRRLFGGSDRGTGQERQQRVVKEKTVRFKEGERGD